MGFCLRLCQIMGSIYPGGVYLDTDVLLHNNLDELLLYESFWAQEDIRYISTGLGFGAEKGNTIVNQLMDKYNYYIYPEGVNSERDTKIFEEIFTEWKKSEDSQIINNNLILGLKNYSKYAKHLATFSWLDIPQKEREKKNKEIVALMNNKKTLNSRYNLFKYRIKRIVRNKKIVNYFEQKRNSKITKLYIFFAYDFLDYGLLHYIKLICKKIFKR